MVAASTVANTPKRARKANRNCWRLKMYSRWLLIWPIRRAHALEQALPDINHVVGLERIGQARVDRVEFSVRRLAADFQTPVRAALRYAPADGERLHHGHGRLQPIRTRALDFPVDVENRGALHENRVAVLQLNIP